MNPRQAYEASRLQRGQQLRNEGPSEASEIRVISTPPQLVRAGQEYLRQQGQQVFSASKTNSRIERK